MITTKVTCSSFGVIDMFLQHYCKDDEYLYLYIVYV